MRQAAQLEDLPPAPPETFKQRVTYWQYRTIWALAAALPRVVARRMPGVVGRAWHRFGPAGQRDQVRRNLERVAPDASEAELARLVREAYVSYARYWIDSFRLHRMDAQDVLAVSTGEGLEHIDAFRDSGEGGVLATVHLGSWDMGAFYTDQRKWGMVVVAEVVRPRRLFERFVRLRRHAGIDVIPLVRGGDMLTKLERRIRDAGALATLVADRDLTRKGPIVEFFGEPCRLPPGAAVLAQRTGRPVVAGAFVTVGRGYRAVIRAPVEVAELSVYDGTQVVAHELEQLIGSYPQQWHVFVPNWLADREPDHPVVAAWQEGRDWKELARQDWSRRRGRSGRAGQTGTQTS